MVGRAALSKSQLTRVNKCPKWAIDSSVLHLSRCAHLPSMKVEERVAEYAGGQLSVIAVWMVGYRQ